MLVRLACPSYFCGLILRPLVVIRSSRFLWLFSYPYELQYYRQDSHANISGVKGLLSHSVWMRWHLALRKVNSECVASFLLALCLHSFAAKSRRVNIFRVAVESPTKKPAATISIVWILLTQLVSVELLCFGNSGDQCLMAALYLQSQAIKQVLTVTIFYKCVFALAWKERRSQATLTWQGTKEKWEPVHFTRKKNTHCDIKKVGITGVIQHT